MRENRAMFASLGIVVLFAIGCGSAIRSEPDRDERVLARLEASDLLAVPSAMKFRGETLLVSHSRRDGSCSMVGYRAEIENAAETFSTGCSGGFLIVDGEVLLQGPDGEIRTTRGERFLAWLSEESWVRRSSSALQWSTEGEVRVVETEALGLRNGRLVPGGTALIAIEWAGEGERLVRISDEGELLPLTEWFFEIESWDLADDGVEMVFSGRRESGLDVYVASTERPMVNPVPSDPADERGVAWAPVGYKFGFIVDSPAGSVVRSVHVPTGAMTNAIVPGYSAERFAWHPDGERITIWVSSEYNSPGIAISTFRGDFEGWLTAPVWTTDRDSSAIRNGRVFPPTNVHYGQKYPLVVLVRKASSGFEPAVGRLLGIEDAGVMITQRAPLDQELSSLGWVDRNGIFVITEVCEELDVAAVETYTVGCGASESGSAAGSLESAVRSVVRDLDL